MTWRLALVLLGAAAIMTALARAVMLGRRPASRPAPQAVLLGFPVRRVLGPDPDCLGDQHAPYALVEFLDYECPACRASADSVRTALDRHPAALRVAVRHYPLTVHPGARAAGRAAEAARSQGAFWKYHWALLKLPAITDRSLVDLAGALGLDVPRFERCFKGRADTRVRHDLADATALKLRGTPAFLLCCPDGRVVYLGGVEQLDRYVQDPPRPQPR